MRMLAKSGASAVLAMSLCASAAPSLAVEEAAGVLKRAAAAIGADEVQSLRFSAAGTGYTFGQAFVPGQAWPKIDIQELTRLMNYGSGALREEIAFSRGEPKGGGGYPLSGQVRNVGFLGGGIAWNQAGNGVAPAPRNLIDRTHQLWTSPHGLIKAAQRNNARLTWRSDGNKPIAVVSFTEPARFSAVAYINADYMIERIESLIPDPVMGDTKVDTLFTNWRDYNGVKFPGRIQQSQGGHPVLDVSVSRVERNPAADIPVPEAVRNPVVENVTNQKVADGVWHLAGGSHNSVLIEMKDHLVLVESPLYDARVKAVAEAVKKLVPNKPVRYMVNSHPHFDHAGGVRAAVAEGWTIVTDTKSHAFFAKTLATANRILPDAMAKSGKKPRFKTYSEHTTLTDGNRTLHIHRIAGNDHSDVFAMVYLPKEKLLIEADAFTPPPPNTPAPATANRNTVNLVDNIARLKLDVATILPLHGRVVPVAELYTQAKVAAPK